MAEKSPMLPTYYVRHPDGSISIAEPQPTAEQIAAQDRCYAQCDCKHEGGCCPDPDCHVYRRLLRTSLRAQRDELFAALEELLADMVIAQGNMRHAAKRDPSWEGCAEAIEPRCEAARTLIAKVKGGAL